MEKIKEISRKYILEDDFDRLMNSLNKLKQLYSGNNVDVIEKHFIEITTIGNECLIDFDRTEKVKTKESNIVPYLEYILQIYKETADNQNCMTTPVIKIESNSNYMQIVVDDVRIDIKNEKIDSIFTSLKNSGLIDSYSIYSSEEKYQKIKKLNYCLSPDEFGFNFYKKLEVPKIKKENNPQKVKRNNK